MTGYVDLSDRLAFAEEHGGGEARAGHFRDAYAKTSPAGPGHFDGVFEKIIRMWRNPLEMPIAELTRITVPVLVMQGDDDGVRLDRNLEVARALTGRQLAVVPGTGRGAPRRRADLVNRMILGFLAARRPQRLLALGALHDQAAPA